MGRVAQSVLPFISPVGGAILGAHQQRKAERRARNEAAEQRSQLQNQQSMARAETERMNKQIQSAQERIRANQARSARRRIRGGLFGDVENQAQGSQGVLNPRLG